MNFKFNLLNFNHEIGLYFQIIISYLAQTGNDFDFQYSFKQVINMGLF